MPKPDILCRWACIAVYGINGSLTNLSDKDTAGKLQVYNIQINK